MMKSCSQFLPRTFGKLPLLSAICMTLLMLLPLSALAQSVGLSHRSYMLGSGYANILDTYLSAESYKGEEIRYVSTVHKPTRWKNIWKTVMNEGSLSIVSNRADNNDETGGAYRFEYHLRHQWAQGNLSIEAGAAIGARLGFLYNTRNSNNPAQVYASIDLMPSAAASYSFTLFKRSSYLRYELAVPLAGLMFSPNYGQSYYEIFTQGNYDHNIVPTTIGTTPSLRHSLTLDVPLLRRKPMSMVRIGYLGDYQQAKVNHLKQHHYSHLLLIGWTKYF